MRPEKAVSRRTFLATTGAATVAAFAGCSSGEESTAEPTPDRTATEVAGTATPTETGTATASDTPTASGLVSALEREVVPVELTESSAGLDAAADRLADAPIVGIGEHSHGVREFKEVPDRLVRRLVGEHGYRLIAIEGTLGDFDPVNAYVTAGEGDLESALASLEFYFWKAEEMRGLFEWLREFNRDRPEDDRVVVRGYDAQFHDVNATAIQSYFERVDPDFLDGVADELDPLTRPLYEEQESEFVTDEREDLLDRLDERLASRESEYVEGTSQSEWELARRHVWTLERGLQFLERYAAEEFAAGKEIRDAAMADNVAWLREWTGTERAVVMGNANHTMRGAGHENGQGARMGQHLTDEFGDDYYALGLLFGTGAFAVPANHAETEFETYELGGPVDGTVEATLAEIAHPQCFLDFDAARKTARIEEWLADVERVQVSVPRAPRQGAVPLPEPPGDRMDGVVFLREVSAASFPYAE